jgi:hypothetical protein
MRDRRIWFLAGLFFTTLATLTLEILNTRLLSVLTWYHLSFFAVSTAMFGMSAGAVRVYLGGAVFEGDGARRALARLGTWFALSIPFSHIANLCIPIPSEISLTSISALVLTTLSLTVPFYLSGMLVAIALTRIPGRSGLIYAVDLIGASVGSLLIIPLLTSSNISSAALVCGAIAAGGAVFFHVFSGTGRWVRLVALAALLIAAAGLNNSFSEGLRVAYPKGRFRDRSSITAEFWTIHGQVIVGRATDRKPLFWGPGKGAFEYKVNLMGMAIDGGAGTSMTRWDGDWSSIAWVQHDVTSLAYHLRKGGDVSVIGVGGGRDLLTALWAKSRSVKGIEINHAFIQLLTGRFRRYAGLADRPEVTLVHDEARSYLTRTEERYDVLQMSLTDTWAATGAGAFTLSENGLYTVEAWRVFLSVLKPRGIFSVSRWYSPVNASETSRLVALATASLLGRGVPNPADHIALVAQGLVATLLVTPEPLSQSDLNVIERARRRFGFKTLLAPGWVPATPALGRIASSKSLGELQRAVADRLYDYSPPTDRRPYFFNILKPGSILAPEVTAKISGGVVLGNLLASRTLAVLWMLSALLVTTIIIGPLWRSGLPKLDRLSFGHAVAYFALIGLGFMLVQIPLMQRFSVYLGHPTYAVAVILFSMILMAGIGSLLSDLIPVEASRRWMILIPLGIAAILLVTTLSIQSIIDSTIRLGLFPRCAIVVALVGTAALPLGLCFPVGLRLVRRLSGDAMPWMWGVNGAFGVLASVSAVGISMWGSIHMSLFAATIAYALLAIPAIALWGRGARSGRVG